MSPEEARDASDFLTFARAGRNVALTLVFLFSMPVLAWWMLRDPKGQAQLIVEAILFGAIALVVVLGLTKYRHVVTYEDLVRRRKKAEALDEMVFGPARRTPLITVTFCERVLRHSRVPRSARLA